MSDPPPDPFVVLGLDEHASLAEVRAARRRLAFDLHPDRGGDADRMRELNAAFQEAVARLTGRVTHAPGRSPGPTARDEPPVRRRVRRSPRWVERDDPSFTIDRLPAEAFEALLVVTSWLGEVLVDDPPYLLEVHLHDPAPCWCRLELLPEAGGSIVTVTVAGVAGPPPPVEDVRDRWVAELNRLGEHT